MRRKTAHRTHQRVLGSDVVLLGEGLRRDPPDAVEAVGRPHDGVTLVEVFDPLGGLQLAGDGREADELDAALLEHDDRLADEAARGRAGQDGLDHRLLGDGDRVGNRHVERVGLIVGVDVAGLRAHDEGLVDRDVTVPPGTLLTEGDAGEDLDRDDRVAGLGENELPGRALDDGDLPDGVVVVDGRGFGGHRIYLMWFISLQRKLYSRHANVSFDKVRHQYKKTLLN